MFQLTLSTIMGEVFFIQTHTCFHSEVNSQQFLVRHRAPVTCLEEVKSQSMTFCNVLSLFSLNFLGRENQKRKDNNIKNMYDRSISYEVNFEAIIDKQSSTN